MKKILIITLIAVLIAASIFCPAASARYAANGIENTGIYKDETVYLGERGLDFSDFSTSTLTVDKLVKGPITAPEAFIPLTNAKGDISGQPGVYMPYNGTTPLNTGLCNVANLEDVIGSITVTSADNNVLPSENPTIIPKTVALIFSVKGGSITTMEQQLSGNWNSMTLVNKDTASSLVNVKNIHGVLQSLKGIQTPSAPGDDYAFRLIEQTTLLSASGDTLLEITFQVSLNGAEAKKTYSFTASSSSLGFGGPQEISLGGTGSLTFTGVSGQTYTITTPAIGPEFIDIGIGQVTYVDRHTVKVTPDWSGSVLLSIQAPDTIKLGTYVITAVNDNNQGEKTETVIYVTYADMKLLFEEPSGDVSAGLFAVGETIRLKGTISNAPFQSIPIYLFITGHGLPKNGVNLQGEPITDGDASTFSIGYYNPNLGEWTYGWTDSSKFEPGMYTIHANLEPYGFIESSTPGTDAYNNHLSHEYSIRDTGLHAKFSSGSNGRFTQGDYFYSFWEARSTPPDIRWYIIGENICISGIEEDIIYFNDEVEAGVDAVEGYYGFTYPRTFTNNLDPGSYYLIYQHPGVDKRFDVLPNIDNGEFTSLITTYGETFSVGSRPGENIAYVVQSLISDSLCDDEYVVTGFTIESPYIQINQLDHVTIGDKITISGVTNYAADEKTADGTRVGDTFSLLINKIDFGLTEDNAAMQLHTVSRITPDKVTPYEGKRTYRFEEIDTSTWFEGTYMATVTNVNTGFSSAMTFTVEGEGIEIDYSTLEVPADPLAEPDTTLEPLPPIVDYSLPTEPVAPESPGFLLAPFALGAAIALRRK